MSVSTMTTPYDPLPVGVAVVDSELRVVAWNATLSKWSGLSSDEAVGSDLETLFPKAKIDRLRERLMSVFNGGQSVVLSSAIHKRVLPLTSSDGRPLRHKAYGFPAPDDPGRVLLVIEDMTTAFDQLEVLRGERQLLREKNDAIVRAQQRAEKASLAKSEFLANMSHEIRTPLTAIKGFAELIASDATDEFVRDAAARVVRNGEHLLGLVNGVLDLSRIEAGKFDLSHSSCSPKAIAEEVVGMLARRAEEKEVELSLKIHDDTPGLISTDPLRLRQVLLNLVENAVKFVSAGSVRVEVRADPAGVRWEVIDTGIGVPPDKLETIFAPFTQADKATHRRFGGSGLGLSICRQLVDRLGGGITVQSDVGVGSTFSFWLPLGEPVAMPDPVQTPRARPRTEARPLAGRRVLVAEDGPDNRQLIDFLLSRAGAKVTLVEDGAQATEAITADAGAFDLVVLDMQMPVLDGYGAAAAMREQGLTLPIIALTASAMEGDRDKALRAGCDAYVAKPIDAPELIRLLAQMTVSSIPAGPAVTAHP